jgi:Tfp pilus assembly protein PilV
MTDTALTDDEGFGLVEAVVSMLILATLAIAFLPLLITGLKQSATNSTQALATQLVSERMSLAQAATTCSALTLVASSASETDPRGNVVDITTTVQDCTAGTGTYAVTATARLIEDGVPGDELAIASTLVFLP